MINRESVAVQHTLVRFKKKKKNVMKHRPEQVPRRTKWWRLREESVKLEFKKGWWRK